MQIDLIFYVLILIFSVILHEVAHGYMANYLGDPTARLQGRLTLNPISHIDPIGSVLLPALLVFSGMPPLGYAKPVPHNPYYLAGRNDETLVAFAGPGTNILLALLFGLGIRFGANSMSPELLSAFTIITIVNISLGLFNLIPIPPLDGSKVLAGILPKGLREAYDHFRANFERLGFFVGIVILLICINVFAPYFSAAVTRLFLLLTGAPF
jgi:Zn-dependent protease